MRLSMAGCTEHHRFLLKLHLDQHGMRSMQTIRVSRRRGRERQIDAPRRAGQGRRAAALFPTGRISWFRIPGSACLSAITILSGDRQQHEPLSDGRPSHRLGGAVSRPERERRQTQALRACARARPGSRPCSFNAPGRPSGSKTATTGRSSYRLQARRGPQKAICAVAASILTAIYHMLKDGAPHRDLGIDYFDQPQARGQSQAAGRPTRQARLRGTTPTPRRGCLMLRSCYIAEVSCRAPGRPLSRL